MKKVMIFMFLVALSIHAQDLTPIKGGQVSWLDTAGASATTISGTDSLFSPPIDVRAYDSLHFAIALPASDSARFFVIGEFGVAGIYTGQVTADSIVSIGTAALKSMSTGWLSILCFLLLMLFLLAQPRTYSFITSGETYVARKTSHSSLCASS